MFLPHRKGDVMLNSVHANVVLLTVTAQKKHKADLKSSPDEHYTHTADVNPTRSTMLY